MESAQPVEFLKVYFTWFLPSFALEGLKALFVTASPLNVPSAGFADKLMEELLVNTYELKLDEVAVSLVQPSKSCFTSLSERARLKNEISSRAQENKVKQRPRLWHERFTLTFSFSFEISTFLLRAV